MQQRTPHLRLWLLGAATFCFTLAPQVALAAEPIHTVLDGHELSFPIAPVIENDRTLVPARGLIEALGGTVKWDQPTRTVSATLGSTTVAAVIGSTTAQVNGKSVQLQVPPRIEGEGHTFIPLRFFVENLGLLVSWDGDTRTIFIDSRNAPTVSRDGSTVSRTGATVVAEARKLVGMPYSWGGTSPETGFDCSGLVWYVGNKFGVDLPRTSQEMFDVGTAISRENLQAGDLVFFTTYAPGPSHVGIYDGQGGFIHSQNAETGVKVTQLASEWWASRYLGARRVFR